MRTTVALLALLAVASAESMEEKFAAKLESPFLKNAAWVHSYEHALKTAKAEGKLVFAYFTRSYAP